MLHIFNEIFGRLVERFIGEAEFILGGLSGLGFWSLDYSIIELRERRLTYSLGCAVIGVVLVAVAFVACRDGAA